MKSKGLIIAGTQSSSGKTALTSMILAAMQQRGISVQPFKVGPDFIDPGYHRVFSGEDSVNLDSWIMGESEVRQAASRFTLDRVGIVEGVMGLFDGANPSDDQGSTMEIARWLKWPVLLVVDTSHAGRSIVASIRGFLDEAGPGMIEGLILNRLGSEGHGSYLQKACAELEVPILGMLPKIQELEWPERHLGLQASQERKFPEVQRMAEIAENRLDLSGILNLLDVLNPLIETFPQEEVEKGPKKRIGVARDEAFHFYYRANMEWLKRSGAEMIPFSPLNDSNLPPNLDGVLIGGGFPEVHAEKISANQGMREALREAITSDMPCYAECGGLMLLAEAVMTQGGTQYPMVGTIPGCVEMTQRLQNFGYCQAKLDKDLTFRGHEFHYSVWNEEQSEANAWTVLRHADGKERKEGFKKGNLHASFVHLYFPNAEAIISPMFGLEGL